MSTPAAAIPSATPPLVDRPPASLTPGTDPTTAGSPQGLSAPAWLRTLVLVVCAVAGLTGLALLAGAALQSPRAWFAAVFALVIIGAAAFGVHLARQARLPGRAVSLLCVAGCVGCGGLFAHLSVSGQLLGRSVLPLTAALLLASALLTGLAGLEVLLRKPAQTLPRLVKGVLLLVPLGVIFAFRNHPALAQSWSALPPMAKVLVAIFGFLVLAGIFCAAAHLLIRAFAVGVEAAEEAEDRPA